MTPATATEQITCIRCASSVDAKPTRGGNKRLPRGWKRLKDEPWCPSCWREAFVLRAITLSVAGPEGIEWPELRERLRDVWRATTSCSNWAIARLRTEDGFRRDEEKLWPMPSVYLYPEARALYPSIPSQSVTSILQSVERRYRAMRFEIVWMGNASLPSFRYPAPFPVHNQGWTAREGDGGELLVSLRLGGERVSLRLRTGKNRAALDSFREIADGRAVQGELSLFEKRASDGDHRVGASAKKPGGGQRVPTKVVAKLVAWFPRKEAKSRSDRVLEVATRANTFLVAKVGDRDPWILHADHAMRRFAAHRGRLQHLADDSKYEKRLPPEKLRQINDHRRMACDKHARWVDSFCKDVASQIAGYAARRGCGVVSYDDSEVVTAEFPWFRLKTEVANALNQRGIELRAAE